MEVRVALRVLWGVGMTIALIIGITVITFGGVTIHGWLHHHRGLGEGEGYLCVLISPVTPVIGLITAWKKRVGIVLGVLLLLAVSALHVMVMFDL